MTSGRFHSIHISQIKVDREGRQREELTDLDSLADSINRLGLIHPIVITRDGTLIAGERRLRACKQLGWDMIPCQYTDELDDLILRLIELEENIKRVDISWQDTSRAISEYHSIRQQQNPGWTQEDTAEAIGLAQQTVSRYLAVDDEIRSGNKKLLELPKLSTASGVVKRLNERRTEAQLHKIYGDMHREEDKEIDSVDTADFRDWVLTYDGPKFNFIHCDFPYGIEANKQQQGSGPKIHGDYHDDEEIYWDLCSSLLNNLGRVSTDSCHIMFWFSMHYYQRTLDFFADRSDFVLDPFPLIWLKSDNVGLLPDPQRGPRRIYETCFFGSRGDRKIISAVSNAYAAPTDRALHMSTKPEPVLRHFFRMFVDEHSLVLDPTCGSGTTLRAAESLGANHVRGVEINPDFANRARETLSTSRRMRAVTTKRSEA